eukprot:GILI01003805.1.p1 GENE.GILI01003805.1~~GILI01003805.1.p1  ORF type:complete len:525 (+),score=118.46 GILI01003805.1:148-1722(+)
MMDPSHQQLPYYPNPYSGYTVHYYTHAQPLLAESESSQAVKSDRKYQDKLFALAYLGCLFLLLAIGISSSSYANFDFEDMIDVCAEKRRALVPSFQISLSLVQKLKKSAGAIGLILGVVFFLGCVWLWLLKAFAKPMIYLSIFAAPALFLLAAVIPLSSDISTSTSYILLSKAVMTPTFVLVAGATLLALFLLRRRIAVTSQLLQEACRALQANLTLLPVCLSLLVTGTGALALFTFFSVSAILNGSLDEDCNWVWTEGSKWYVAGSVLFALWTFSLFQYIRMATVAATAGMWFFNQENPFRTSSVSLPSITALFWSLTTSFGSLCFASLVMALANFCRLLVDHWAKQRARQRSVAASCLSCIAEVIQNLVGFINKFAVAHLAITGDDFLKSSNVTFALLKRHGLSTFAVDRLASLCLFLHVAGISVLASVTSFVVTYHHVLSQQNPTVTDATQLAWDTGVVAGSYVGVASLAALSFLAGIVLNMVDALYVCYATDVDRKTCHQQGVHAVFQQRFASTVPVLRF